MRVELNEKAFNGPSLKVMDVHFINIRSLSEEEIISVLIVDANDVGFFVEDYLLTPDRTHCFMIVRPFK